MNTHAQAMLLVAFGFIIRDSHRPFFAFCFTFLVVGFIGFGFIFFISSKIWPVYAGIFCLGAALIHVAHPPAMDILHDWRGQLKQSLYHYLDDEEAGTMSAIVLGDRGQIPKEINMAFRHTGTGHILVIAGLHMAMMTAMVIFILKLIRIPRPWQVVLSILLIFTYALLTGGSIPVMRAAFMASVILASFSVELESDALNSLSFAALILLLMDASNLFDTSFQLSFAAVAAIIILYTPIEKRLSFFPKWLSCCFGSFHSRVDRDHAFSNMAFWHHRAGGFDSQFIYCSFIGYNSCFRFSLGIGGTLGATISVGLGRLFEDGF